MEMIRSFIAFDMDDKSILRNFSKVQDMLVGTKADLKMVKPENIHITLRFLGNIQPSLVDEIYREMEKIEFAPFDIEIKGLGVFPNLRYIRVIWAGIQIGADNLSSIFNQLEPGLRQLGFKPDYKGFSPHITIARVQTNRHKDELVKCIQEMASYEFGIVKAKCLRLKRSILAPKGPIYSVLKETCR